MNERHTSNTDGHAGGARRGQGEGPRRKVSIVKRAWRGFGRVAGSPSAAVGMEEIRQGAGYIRNLSELLRSEPRSRSRLLVHADGSLDMIATAFAHGLSVDQLEHQLATRRRQTARTAYFAFGLGWCSIVLWLWQAVHTPLTYARIVAALEFMPFCAAFFLLAFRNAWLNWQLRTRQVGSASNYLQTNERFWPS